MKQEATCAASVPHLGSQIRFIRTKKLKPEIRISISQAQTTVFNKRAFMSISTTV